MKLTDLKSEAIDERSQKGQFGWFTLGDSPVPMIYRNVDEEYCSVRMAEQAGLKDLLKYFNKDIFTCIDVKSHRVTPSEGALLNTINFVHCDSHFGMDIFTNDLIVKVVDVIGFYDFLTACYAKLKGNQTATADQKFGFIIINKDSVVPYSVSKGRKLLPLFYFEGEMEQLTTKSYTLEGWDLSYLKFCCKIQGIKNQHYSDDTCAAIDLEDIKIFFPPDTTFEEHWLPKLVDAHLITNRNQSTQSGVGCWSKLLVSQMTSSNSAKKSDKAKSNNSQLLLYLNGS